MAKNIAPTQTKVLTRGTKKLIAKVVKDRIKAGNKDVLNSTEICSDICEDLCSKFSGDSLDYQLMRMGLETTGDIIDAIDVYIYRHAREDGITIVD